MKSLAVIIPLYNKEQWIGETLESLLNQSYPSDDYELIIVDDGSTDGSPIVAERVLSRANIQYRLMSVENGGPSRARNIGFQSTDAPWIQFLDADDLLAPSKLSMQMAAARAAAESVAVIYSPWARLTFRRGEWDTESVTRCPGINNTCISELLIPKNALLVGALLVRRNWLLQSGGFNEDYDQIEDIELMLRLAMLGGSFQCVMSAEPLFRHRQLSNSLSRVNQDRFVMGCVRNAEFAEAHLSTSESLNESAMRTVVGIYAMAAHYFAPRSRPQFNRIAEKIEALLPGYTPESPKLLQISSAVLGYRRAENFILPLRKLRYWVMKHISRSHGT